MIRLAVPSIGEDDLRAVCEVLTSGHLVQGERVAAFERAVAEYVGIEHAVAVSSCTAALHIALLALGVGPGDIVVVPAYSFIATGNVVELCGAQPVFVDIDLDVLTMDPNCLEAVLGRLMSTGDIARRVRAVVPVHTFGQMADMPAILALACRYDLPVLEDAACALGAALDGRQAGTFGSAGCFSFHPRKAITTGEGGVVVTSSQGLARHLRALRNHGQSPDGLSPDFVLPGFNYRMTEFQAALGLSQMGKLGRIVSARRRLAACYDDCLRGTPVRLVRVPRGSEPVYQSYVAMLPTEAGPRRDEIIAHLRERGIEVNIGTWHMPMTEYFRNRYGYELGDFPAADKVFARSLALPLYESLSEPDQQEVVDVFRAVLGGVISGS